VWRVVLVTMVVGIAVINAAGVYAQLLAAHVGDRGAAAASIESQDAALAARIEVAAGKVADLDRRLGQIDQAVEEAAKRGRTNATLSAIEGQRRARGSLVDERNREAGTVGSPQGRARPGDRKRAGGRNRGGADQVRRLRSSASQIKRRRSGGSSP
jgi:hypothetical protein